MTYAEQSTKKNVTENQAREYNTGATTSTSSSTTVDTRPGVLLEPWEWEQIRQAYESLLGRLNIYKAQDIEKAVERRVEVSAILDALEQTAFAPRPSHAYFRAILIRYANHCILTAEAAEQERAQRRKARYVAKQAQWNAWYEDPGESIDNYY